MKTLNRLMLGGVLLFAGAAVQAGELHLQRITPEGDSVPASSQITLSFDQPVVPLGRMERSADEVPVSISPDPGCSWRWLDPQILACNLPGSASLREATAYTVLLRPDLVALSGDRLSRAHTQRFVTERPSLSYAQVAEWRGATQPVLRLRFNQAVTAASVAQVFSLDREALTVEPELFDDETPFYTPDGEARSVWRVTPQTALRPEQTYTLQLTEGLRSAFGAESGIAAATKVSVTTFPPPRYLGIECTVADKTRTFAGKAHVDGCAPDQTIGLVFSAPVSVASLRSALQLSPDPMAGQPADDDFDPWAGMLDQRPVSAPHRKGQTYTVTLPFTFKAETAYTLALSAGAEDRFGRALHEVPQTAFTTGARGPRLVLDHERAVLEAGVDSEVPVVVTNLQSLDTQFDRLDARGLATAQQHQTAVAPVRNLAFAMPLDVRGMLDGRSGAVIGAVRTTPETRPDEHTFFAEVTPWQVHAKLGNSNTLVWVTQLSDGAPVVDAEVAVLAGFGTEVRASARTDADGVAMLPGSADLDPELNQAWNRGAEAMMVRVTRGDDFALLPLEYDFQVDVWRSSHEQISAWRRQRHAHLRAWGATAQGVYRAGDTVQYKIYVRDDAGKSLAPAQSGSYTLQIYDAAGTVVQRREKLVLNAYGAIDGSFVLGKTAVVGWYRYELQPDFAPNALEPLRMLVADFVPAPFRVTAELQASTARPDQVVNAQVSAALHGGGAFAAAPATLQARLQATGFSSDDPRALGYRFDSVEPDQRDIAPVLDQRAQLDAQGQWSAALKPEDAGVYHGVLLLEAAVQDDRGRSVGARNSVPYHGRDRLIGVRFKSWTAQAGQPSVIEAIVVDADADGVPVDGAPYYIKVERKKTVGARVKGAGNAYITRYSHSWERVQTCKGRAQHEGMRCSFTPDAAGELRITAMTRDTADRLQQTQDWIYARGPQAVLWEDTPDYSLDLRVDQAKYTVGDTARVFVKNPFPGARALITVERYGVLRHWAQTLAEATPVIEIPIQPEDVPGSYVSVLVMSPRVAAPQADGGVDLGKPTFRMGYATLNVDTPHRQIDVEVTPAQTQYRPRESVAVQLQATPRHPSQEPIEFAVAVLDEAVFDLIGAGASAYDPLKGFNALDGLDLANYGLLTRLVGRQKFEKKGASAGGDGGGDLSLRSVERFVAYWNPSLPADAQGRAQFSFALPDQLTGWRVMALAVTPGDRMGLGQGAIKVSKPTELRPLMPNQLAAGDRFDAAFSVLNRADTTRTLEVSINVSGALAAGSQPQLKQQLTLAPFERQTVRLPVQVGDEAEASALHFVATAGDAQDRDALEHTVTVRASRRSATAGDLQSLQAGQPLQQQVAVPDDVRHAELQLQFSGSLIGNLDGAFEYLRDYPYDCWEQRLSRAVMAAQYLKLRDRLSSDVRWPEAETVIADALRDTAQFQAPRGGMAFFVAGDAQASPYLTAFTSLAFGWLQALGYTPPALAWDRMDAYLQAQLQDDPEANGYDSAEARAQLRAVIAAALAQRGSLEAAEIQRQLPQLPRMGLFGESLFLQAAQGRDADAARAARQRMLARMQLSAGSASLRDDQDSAWSWLLGSSLRAQCAALSALLAAPDPAMRDDELPLKLVRSITAARGARSHWPNTQENLFCAQAVIDYAQRFEAEPVSLQIAATLDQTALGAVSLQGRGTTGLQQAVTPQAVPQQLRIEAEGRGRAYATTRLSFVEPDTRSPESAGMTVHRAYFVYRDGGWQPLQDSPMRVRRGDWVRVDLNLETPAWMVQVVVDDPVPGGLEPLNPDLATAAGIELPEGGGAYPYPFDYRELRFDAVRHFAAALPAGQYALSWVGQAVSTGEFAVGRVHAEQMYEPDVYANGGGARLVVEEVAP
ncbi:hypothetical protein E4T66_09920 [Sinimarinibacterium sp. CAU 1509]|uniref:alpha-2-macroglobulin family protein n=1 Tax=Sinimarinibacterium sp. CAU 1509 TaxID=2562283 RepID=UPI0010AD4CF0|nr:alpha-2-macroglobulin family protein [Sinimarinibacterium sp. CAU 1509]TJY60956.1 hypothetical protein E4T66_09920 [Sinimarinibacterium sp. CAU 1509]